MAAKQRKPSSLPARILARMMLMVFGFLVGVALFTPWNKIWASALTSLDERLPSVRLRWDSIDRDGPFGFRVNGLRVAMADTPGSLAFSHASVRVGLSPLARVRLDTGGSQCELDLFQNGTFEFEGDFNLTSLLGGTDFKGNLHVAGNLFLPDGAILPKTGWLDIRSQQLVLPDGKTITDFAFTAEINHSDLDVRDFSIGSPVAIRTAGRGLIDPSNLYRTTFDLKGELTIGKRTLPYETQGTLADAIW
ncbi:MAG: hypothetical protein KUA35_05970 [Pseudodesulfovibrio sp.]|uniref:Type II secretion system protein N n=1 Tax=Pseudodesulfovibrio aespoeensis (strain ATCC 700646 / DSM 10631 / Aspo-2) TaxID=643562 RepID=E6VSH3_PSEA9|nr:MULTISPECIES: hypothetical protein [Pseudodesulfovibrio]MBU4190708.1 hypothetical protein [Pseudomonadota bacterium]MCG2731582.1 hypothetical protein [Pseudodesulfovibrio aespoeensis]ADU64316.1 hypothetical protein Daes_3328 [Pseudodesulfovibrio aespoeensis Aspo-2]MBU4243139.1 hypothetical protein [Pseudomonadota bacterium]MBU4377873.1 hypothetical protein [Pseudomonadota bacterium]